MSNQNQLAKTSIKTVSGYFADQVSKYLAQMPGIIGDAEARRLTAVLCIKAQATMEESGITWEQIDAAKFAMDAIKVVTLGLDASMNECYPIPYRNNKTNRVELQCSPSAKGMIKLVMNYASGPKKIKDFRSYVIREGDEFTLERTPGNDIWKFKQDIFGEGKAKAYVTIVVYEDGTSFVMPHTKADIEKRRSASKAPNSPAWKNWYDEMALAKGARRHCNAIPMQMPKAVEDALNGLDDEFEETKDVTPPTISLEAPQVREEEPEAAQPVYVAPAQPQPQQVRKAAQVVESQPVTPPPPMEAPEPGPGDFDLSWLDDEPA